MSSQSPRRELRSYAQIRRELRDVPKIEFFSRRKILGEGFFGWVFDDGPHGVVKVSFDRGFREMMISPDRPQSLHLPQLHFDYGVTAMPSGLSLHVVSCERLAAVEPLSDLWQLGYDLNQALDEAWQEQPLHDSPVHRMEALAAQIAFLKTAAPAHSMKECLQELHHFAAAHDLALSPYFTRHHENLMRRDNDLVFINPLYDPYVDGLPTWIFGGLGGRRSSEGDIAPLRQGNGRAKMNEDEFRDETGGRL